jgi:hypothetical protein
MATGTNWQESERRDREKVQRHSVSPYVFGMPDGYQSIYHRTGAQQLIVHLLMRLGLFQTMRSLTIPAIIAILYASATMVVAAGFEGTVVYKITERGASHNIVYRIKGPIVRLDFDVQGRPMAAICNNADSSTMLLLLAEKMVVDLPAVRVSSTDAGAFSPTGNTRTILGYSASEYMGRINDSTTVHVWYTGALGSYFAVRNVAGTHEVSPWESWARTQGLFPLSVTEAVNGRETRIDAVSVNTTPVGDETIAIPEGFTKLGRLPGTK